ncbi:MAG: metallophosphoesterase [Planctomycetota bacterium]
MNARRAFFPRTLASLAILAAGSLPARAEIAAWEFEGDLSSATGGEPLAIGAAPPAAEPDVEFLAVSIGGEETIAARFSRGTFFRLAHGFGSTGFRFLNRYTLVLDVLFEDRSPSGGWAALLQTDPANASDADWFVNPAGALGISGQYGGSVPDGAWHRLGLVVDLVAGTLSSYVDGARVGRIAGLAPDGRFALQPAALLFADEDAENAAGEIASLQLRDGALDDDAMAHLGGPTAGGIPRTSPPPPVPVGLWTFDDPANPLAAAIGEDLVLAGTHTTIAGTTEADGAVRIGPGSYYRARHGILPSPGPYVNAYAFLFDFRVPAIGAWYAFFQTNSSNANDADCFARTDGALGVGATGYSAARISAGTWTRMVVTVDNVRGIYEIWLDGERILAGIPQAVDGRFSLDPEVLFFADENGEDGTIDVATLAVYDRALSSSEIAHLGGPGVFDPENRPPTVIAEPAGPESVDAREGAAFQFRARDEDADRVQFRISWGDGTTDAWGPLVAAEEPFLATHAFRQTGVLEISAQARDEHGSSSSWTRVQYVRVTGEVPVAFLLEPYLQYPRPGGISILWELDAPAASRIEYGPDESYGRSLDVEPEDTGYLSWVYRARLDGLAAGEHHYRVVAGSVATGDRTFRVRDATDRGAFSFSVWADSQGTNGGTFPSDPYEPTKAMMRHIAASGDAFAVGVGDLAEDGSDFSGVRRYYLERVAALVGPALPWFVAWGNHDQGRSAVIRKYADLPSAFRPGFDPGWGSYSFDYAGCHFVAIDYWTMAGDVLGWLEGNLAAAAARRPRFTFLFVHVPPYCEIWIDGDAWLRAHLVPLLEEYGVDACFSGHTHEYERGDLRGTTYVVTGGGSWLDFPEPYTVDWPHMTVGGYHDLGSGIEKGLVNEYVRVRVEGDRATVEMHAFYPDGTYRGVLDAFAIERCGNGNGPAADANADGVPDDCQGLPGQIPGDANQDVQLDVSDALWLLLHLYSGTPARLPCEGGSAGDPGPGERALLDWNGDGAIDLSDPVGALGFLFLGAGPHALGSACIPLDGCPKVCP